MLWQHEMAHENVELLAIDRHRAALWSEDTGRLLTLDIKTGEPTWQEADIKEKLKKGQDEILAIRNFGQKSLDELMERLEEKGYLELINEDGIEASEVAMPELAE